jgi:Na+:H+ antiporter, NhaA family
MAEGVSMATPPSPPGAWAPLQKLARFARLPLERFLAIEAASGILLLLAAGLALVLANSPWSAQVADFWALKVGITIGSWSFSRDLVWIVNDGLMVIFFFVVGLEIRREIHHGELSELRRAALPVAAAIGGMIAPALVYLAIAGDPSTRSGWGVPMATDIAFAVGVLALLGRRVPAALRVLLLAVAVIDDLGAILVIAFFYSDGLQVGGFAVAAAGIGGVFVLQGLGVRSRWAYVVPGLVLWAGIYAAGVHPTIAGVILGLLTPVSAWVGVDGLIAGLQRHVEGEAGLKSLQGHALTEALAEVDHLRREATSPAEALIETLHPWVAYGIMPIFALANAGVSVAGFSLAGDAGRVIPAVGLGLLLGKPLGILVVVYITKWLGWVALPRGLGFRHLLVLGVVAGIGFTMALFVAQLAFVNPALLDAARLGILAASGAAGLLALGLGRFLLEPPVVPGVVQTADEAEASTEA